MIDIMCNIEVGIRDLPDNAKEIIRQECTVILRKCKPHKDNINKEEFDDLKSLNRNQDIVVFMVGKGGANIILDKVDYRKKMLDHLENNGCYIKLGKNPLSRISRVVVLAIKSNSLVYSFSHKLIESSPMSPSVCGLPKIHNKGVPLRPIVNNIGGKTYLLAK